MFPELVFALCVCACACTRVCAHMCTDAAKANPQIMEALYPSLNYTPTMQKNFQLSWWH